MFLTCVANDAEPFHRRVGVAMPGGVIAVSPFGDEAQHSGLLAGNQNRNLAGRLLNNQAVPGLMILTLKVDLPLAHQRRNNRNGFLELIDLVVEIESEGIELWLVPTGAYAKNDAPSTHFVERHRHLRQNCRVPERRTKHQRSELNPVGRLGQCAPDRPALPDALRLLALEMIEKVIVDPDGINACILSGKRQRFELLIRSSGTGLFVLPEYEQWPYLHLHRPFPASAHRHRLPVTVYANLQMHEPMVRKGAQSLSHVQSVLEARQVSKSFGAVQALSGANFTVYPAEVVGLIGDNGAGKSTLINVLTGVFPPDTGEIIFEGREVSLHGPQDARNLGIETVYQDLAIAPHLDSVANMYLGREIRRNGLLGRMGFLDFRSMTTNSSDYLTRLRVRIPDPTRPMTTLSGGQRQGVAVARSVMWASKVVIMDEPIAALGVAQAEMVLNLIGEVRSNGIPVVFISHNMPHVFEVCDRIVVLRLGEVVAELDPKTHTIDDAVSLMTGSMESVDERAA